MAMKINTILMQLTGMFQHKGKIIIIKSVREEA